MVARKDCLFYTVILIFTMLLGCSGGYDKETGAYSNSRKGFSIQFPDAWNKAKTTPGALITVASPDQSGQVSIMVQDTPKELTFEQYIKKVSSQQSRVGFRETERGGITMDGIEGHWSVREIKLGGQPFKSISYSVMKENRVYSVVCIVEANEFPDIESVFDDVAKSFRFES